MSENDLQSDLVFGLDQQHRVIIKILSCKIAVSLTAEQARQMAQDLKQLARKSLARQANDILHGRD